MSEIQHTRSADEETSQGEPTSDWVIAILFFVLVLAAFAVPIVGPLRESSARILIAISVLIVGAGLAFLLLRPLRQRVPAEE